jgi:hypothetical protein
MQTAVMHYVADAATATAGVSAPHVVHGNGARRQPAAVQATAGDDGAMLNLQKLLCVLD